MPLCARCALIQTTDPLWQTFVNPVSYNQDKEKAFRRLSLKYHPDKNMDKEDEAKYDLQQLERERELWRMTREDLIRNPGNLLVQEVSEIKYQRGVDFETAKKLLSERFEEERERHYREARSEKGADAEESRGDFRKRRAEYEAQEAREAMEKERVERERKDAMEKEKLERERLERERKELERKEREEEMQRQRKERIDKLQKEREEREQKLREALLKTLISKQTNLDQKLEQTFKLLHKSIKETIYSAIDTGIVISTLNIQRYLKDYDSAITSFLSAAMSMKKNTSNYNLWSTIRQTQKSTRESYQAFKDTNNYKELKRSLKKLYTLAIHIMLDIWGVNPDIGIGQQRVVRKALVALHLQDYSMRNFFSKLPGSSFKYSLGFLVQFEVKINTFYAAMQSFQQIFPMASEAVVQVTRTPLCFTT